MSHCQLCDAPSVGRTCLKCDPGQLVAKDEVSRLRAEVERLTAENAKLEADARLGRMVRAMPPRSRLCRGIPEEGDRRDWYCFWGNGDRAASEGDTPEEALAAAGVKP